MLHICSKAVSAVIGADHQSPRLCEKSLVHLDRESDTTVVFPINSLETDGGHIRLNVVTVMTSMTLLTYNHSFKTRDGSLA